MKSQYQPVSYDELMNRFMEEIRLSSKRLTQLEKVISPLLAAGYCECSDDEANQLQNVATSAAVDIVEEDYGGIEHMQENFQAWLDSQRKQGRI